MISIQPVARHNLRGTYLSCKRGSKFTDRQQCGLDLIDGICGTVAPESVQRKGALHQLPSLNPVSPARPANISNPEHIGHVKCRLPRMYYARVLMSNPKYTQLYLNINGSEPNWETITGQESWLAGHTSSQSMCLGLSCAGQTALLSDGAHQAHSKSLTKLRSSDLIRHLPLMMKPGCRLEQRRVLPYDTVRPSRNSVGVVIFEVCSARAGICHCPDIASMLVFNQQRKCIRLPHACHSSYYSGQGDPRNRVPRQRSQN